MKMLRRQEGYTLLLVLVLVVLLLVVTASFAVASMNQTKQIKSTDISFQTTSLAEMGYEHYSASIKKFITEQYHLAFTRANSIIADNSLTNNEKKQRVELINDDYKSNLIAHLNSVKSDSIEVGSGNYELKDYSFKNESTILLEVSGELINNKSKVITSEILIPSTFFEFDNDANGNVIVTELVKDGIIEVDPVEIVFPTPYPNYSNSLNECDKPKKGERCKSTNIDLSKLKGEIIYSSMYDFSENAIKNSNGNGSILYLSNPTNSPFSFNEIDGLKETTMFLNKNAIFSNFKGSGDLRLFINGNASFNEVNTNKDSFIYVYGDINISNLIKSNSGNTNYKIYANSATINTIADSTSNNSGIENSTLSFKNNLTVEKGFFNGGNKIFAGGSTTFEELEVSQHGSLSKNNFIFNQLSITNKLSLDNTDICVVKSISSQEANNFKASNIYVLDTTNVIGSISKNITQLSLTDFRNKCDLENNDIVVERIESQYELTQLVDPQKLVELNTIKYN